MVSIRDENLALYGTTEGPGVRRHLQAGQLSAVFENGIIRSVKYGATEVIRSISFLVRDCKWGTANPKIAFVHVESNGNHVDISFKALCKTDDGELPFEGKVSMDGCGELVFEAAAKPATDFLTYRTGFVVLFPINAFVGRSVTVTNKSGAVSRGRFPREVDPNVCFTEFTELAFELDGGLKAACEMVASEPYEMEDHRNWLEASFKAYVRPMGRPYPYLIPAGTEDRQRVTLRMERQVEPRPTMASAEIPVRLDMQSRDGLVMPNFGMMLDAHEPPFRNSQTGPARILAPQFLHIRINGADPPDKAKIVSIARLAGLLGARILPEITITDAAKPIAELQRVADLLTAIEPDFHEVVVVPAVPFLRLEAADIRDYSIIERIYADARHVFAKKRLGGGVNGFFCELNRNWPPMRFLDFVINGASAIVHTADDASVMETLESVSHLADTTRKKSGGLPYWLGPACIGIETNPYGDVSPNPNNERTALARVDPRQRGCFGAAWTIGLAAEAVDAGIATLISSALTGDFGVLSSPADRDGRSAVYPIYHAIRGISRAAGKTSVLVGSSEKSRVRAFGYRGEAGTIVWMANMAAEAQTVVADFAEGAEISVLHAGCIAEAASDPNYMDNPVSRVAGQLRLPPYAVARLKIGGS